MKTEEAEELDLYFVIHRKVGTEVKHIDLIENGSSVKVNKENKELYVKK